MVRNFFGPGPVLKKLRTTRPGLTQTGASGAQLFASGLRGFGASGPRWLAGLLAGWLDGWLAGWLDGWLAGWPWCFVS